jgi:hypothetical protein
MTRLARLPLHVLLAAAAAILAGAAGILIASAYPLGTARIIGPAIFPIALSAMLVLCGIGILAEGLAAQRDGKPSPAPSLAAPATVLAILGGPALFGLTVGRLGLVPAVIACVVLVSLAERERPWRTILLLAGGLAGGCTLVFVYLLKLPLEPFLWRW